MYLVKRLAMSPLFRYIIAYYKMILIPMEDTRKQGIFNKLLEGYLYTHRSKTNRLCCITDTKH